MTKSPSTGGGRQLSTRLRPSTKRSPQSKRWLERQLNDP